MQKSCPGCHTDFPDAFQTGFRDTCPKCQAYLHCCRNCRLYDPNAHHQCRSSTTEFVPDKEKANFCEEFDWRKGQGRQPEQKDKEKWDDLFGK